jgi:hypothetical protein
MKLAIDRKGVLEAIRRAASKLGRPPSWSELRRLTGVPESRVRAYFPTIAEAVRAAGLEPNRAGLRIRDEALLEDFARVAASLGRPPSRSEYMREGKYSAGAFYSRFGSWKKISKQIHHGGTETRREAKSGDPVIARSGDLNSGGFETGLQQRSMRESATESTEESGGENHSPQINADEHRSANGRLQRAVPYESDKAIAMQWAGAVTAIPGELAGKRRVTDAVCAMIVNTLLGGDWYGELSRHLGPGKQDPTADERGLARMEDSTQYPAVSTEPHQPAQDGCDTGISIQPFGGVENSSKTGRAESELNPVNAHGAAALARVNGDITSGGILDGGRPVMGPPFHWCALTNAPVNELGVVLLFGMLAGELGFQIEAVWGRYPDIEAKRQIRPGKWQRVKIEAEYESRNFAQHGHNPDKCDVIVCWKHNWTNCPKHIEVIELSKLWERA